jgi:hypothetical protein
MKIIAMAAVSLFVLGAMATPSIAQSDVGEPLGTVYLSPSADSYVPVFQLIPKFALTTIYLVAEIDFTDIGAPDQNLSNGIRGYELSITLPPAFSITSVVTNPAGLLNVASPPDFLIGVGGVLTANNSPIRLLTISVFVTGDVPAPGFVMEIGPVQNAPQTVSGQAIWQEFLSVNGCTNRATGAPERCFFPWASTGNLRVSTEVATEASSWGELKKGY